MTGHARYHPERDNAQFRSVKGTVHRDHRDQSSTLLYLYQPYNTPRKHRAYWYDESTHTLVPIAGGLFLCFNGRDYYHGLIAPSVISAEWGWLGATILMKKLVADVL